MKIAVWHNLPSGGAKRVLYYHVKGLAERGHTLECWTSNAADHSYLPLREFASEHITPFKGKPGVWYSIVEKLTGYSSALELMRLFDAASKQCARAIELGDFDVLFANGSILYHVPFIVRHLQLPKVLYLQEPCRLLYEANPTLPWIANVRKNSKALYLNPRRFLSEFSRLQTLRVQAKEEWVNVHSCDTILVNSHYSRESVLRAYGYDAKVCYLGVDTNLFRNLDQERERFIVGLGSFDRIKGVDLAIRSVALLADSKPPLVWVANSGEQAYIEEMRKLAESLGVNIQIKMRVSDKELVDILNRATLLLYTSRLEPFGLAPLEANACATPVVAVAEGGVRETIKDGVNGFLVDSDPECIAQAMGKLLYDLTLARRIGECAAAYVQGEWSVERSVDRLEAFLLQAASRQTDHANKVRKC